MGLFGPPNIEKLKAKRNVKRLSKLLSYYKDDEIRKKAFFALGEINNAEAIAAISNWLKNNWDKKAQNMAKQTLSKSNRPEAEKALKSYKAEKSVSIKKILKSDIEKLISIQNHYDSVMQTYRAFFVAFEATLFAFFFFIYSNSFGDSFNVSQKILNISRNAILIAGIFIAVLWIIICRRTGKNLDFLGKFVIGYFKELEKELENLKINELTLPPFLLDEKKNINSLARGVFNWAFPIVLIIIWFLLWCWLN